jgi:hypothetical protein
MPANKFNQNSVTSFGDEACGWTDRQAMPSYYDPFLYSLWNKLMKIKV